MRVRQTLITDREHQETPGLPKLAADSSTPGTASERVSYTESRPTWSAKKFSLEIHVCKLNGDAKEIIRYTFGPGQVPYSMGNIMCHIKNKFPRPYRTRPGLSLCGNVLYDESEEMSMKIPEYLHRYCDDYTEDTAELQLHATLTFEPDWSHIYDNQGQCIGAFMSWYICLGGSREGTAASGGVQQHCCRIHTSKDLTIKSSRDPKYPRPSWYFSCLKRYNASRGQLVQF